jgi:membrane associated rhomboid family serine protease
VVLVRPADFALTADALRGDWWRLWTGQIVHYDFAHLLTNAVAIVVPLALVDRRRRTGFTLTIPIVAPLLSLLFLAGGRFDEYRGASALAMALWVAAALVLACGREARDRWTGCALFALAAAKLAAEAGGTGHLWRAVPPLPLAHDAGFAAGVFMAILVEAWSRRTRPGRTAKPPHAAAEAAAAPLAGRARGSRAG